MKPHTSVLLHQSISALNIKPDGIYLDATFGRGGHSLEILNKLDNKGKLFAIDQDPEAIGKERENLRSKTTYNAVFSARMHGKRLLVI